MDKLSKIFSNGPLLIAIAAVLWGLDGIIRRSLYTLPPIIIVFFESFIGALIILPFFLKAMRKESLTRKEFGLIALVSLVSGVLGILWLTTALVQVNFISFSVVYLLIQLEPLFAISTAAIFLREKIQRHYIYWAVPALLAAYFVIFPNGVINTNTGSNTAIAALYALGAAAAWGTSTTISKMALLKKSDVYVTGLRMILTTLFAFVGVVVLGNVPQLSAPTASQFMSFLIIALSTGMVALFLYYKGLKKTEAKITTLLELIFPMLAVFIDAVYYNSYLSISQYAAAAVLLFSIYQISKLNKAPRV